MFFPAQMPIHISFLLIEIPIPESQKYSQFFSLSNEC